MSAAWASPAVLPRAESTDPAPVASYGTKHYETSSTSYDPKEYDDHDKYGHGHGYEAKKYKEDDHGDDWDHDHDDHSDDDDHKDHDDDDDDDDDDDAVEAARKVFIFWRRSGVMY